MYKSEDFAYSLHANNTNLGEKLLLPETVKSVKHHTLTHFFSKFFHRKLWHLDCAKLVWLITKKAGEK